MQLAGWLAGSLTARHNEKKPCMFLLHYAPHLRLHNKTLGLCFRFCGQLVLYLCGVRVQTAFREPTALTHSIFVCARVLMIFESPTLLY